MSEKRVFAFIGARSGSKGLPDKNIMPLHGKPMIAWTIQAALRSHFIEKVFVSTDSETYADVAKHYGAEVIMRPNAISGDCASLNDALIHGYEKINASFGSYDIVVNLQPTSPLRTFEHIDNAIRLYLEHESEKKSLQLFSCYEIDSKYAWAMKVNSQGFAYFIDEMQRNKKSHARQENQSIYLPNGAIFIMSTNNLSSFYSDRSIPFIMDFNDSVDIDTKDDFDMAEMIMARKFVTPTGGE